MRSDRSLRRVTVEEYSPVLRPETMSGYDEPIAEDEKVRIVSSFILHAPPGEFNEVFNDVRLLLNDDHLLKSRAAGSFAQYNKEQFTPAKLGDREEKVLVTSHGEIDGGARFLDPRGKQSFRYDHLRKEASDVQGASVTESAEPYRRALDDVFQKYVANHYPEGVSTVYGKQSGGQITLIACLEDHKFSPRNFWNGRWRSEWTLTFSPGSGTAQLAGNIKIQVHYYEDGNVQLVSSKEVKEQITIGTEEKTAQNIVKVVQKEENDYQTALNENYDTMSGTTFKALRRALPVTRTKLDWNKIASYRVGKEMKQKE
eukprot:m.306350 g.306350  ORF g.306350 m.306350 type:complete len:314 (+) comp41171_c0_seq1:79-1020(+)